jgi:membrane-bound lytic murein transglycosylase D
VNPKLLQRTGPILLLLCLASCAHQPVAPKAPAATPVAAVTAPPTESVAPTAAADAGAPAEAPGEPELPPASDRTSSPGPADLFVRLRGGFELEELDEHAIDAELNWFANHPDYLERVWGRAALYMYYIVDQLEQRKMPRELALLPVIESAFDPYAYSRARASGLWQFIPGTGSRFGVKQDWWYDGRRDVIESTRAALDYLQALHDEFNGDWLLAIAGYNCGELAVQRAIDRNTAHGLPTDFWHLKLPRETRAYVPKLLAMKRLVAHPADYGLDFSPIPNLPYFTQVRPGGQIDLRVVATVAGIPKDDIFNLNPAYHRGATDPTGPDLLLVPMEGSDGLQLALQNLTPEQRMPVQHYTTRRNDSLASIAAQFNTTPAMIARLNDLNEHARPAAGVELRVPSSDDQLPAKALRAAMLVDNPHTGRQRHSTRPVIRIVRRGDTLYSVAQRTGTDVHTLAKMNGMSTTDPLHAGQRLVVAKRRSSDNSVAPSAGTATAAAPDGGHQITYVVRPGDTLYSISRSLQVSVADLLDWNGMSNGRTLKPGKKLVAYVAARG